MARISYQTNQGSSRVRNIVAAAGLLALSGVMALGMAVGGTSPGTSRASSLNGSIIADLQVAGSSDGTTDAGQAGDADAVRDTSGAHFMSASDSVDGSGALVVSFDEAGLGNGNIDYVLTADAVANYGCINGGGHNPRASNKQTTSATVSEGGSFQSRNGRVRASLTIDTLSAGSFSCPAGQTLVLADVSYTNVMLTDTTNDVTVALADVTRTFFRFR